MSAAREREWARADPFRRSCGSYRTQGGPSDRPCGLSALRCSLRAAFSAYLQSETGRAYQRKTPVILQRREAGRRGSLIHPFSDDQQVQPLAIGSLPCTMAASSCAAPYVCTKRRTSARSLHLAKLDERPPPLPKSSRVRLARIVSPPGFVRLSPRKRRCGDLHLQCPAPAPNGDGLISTFRDRARGTFPTTGHRNAKRSPVLPSLV